MNDNRCAIKVTLENEHALPKISTDTFLPKLMDF